MFERHAAAVALAAMMWVGAASAQDFAGGVQVGTGKLEDPKQAGDFMLRLRGLAIVPNESSHINAIGGDVEISNEYTPEVDFTYFLTGHVAFELIAATARHNVRAKDTALGDLDLGKVSHLRKRPMTTALRGLGWMG